MALIALKVDVDTKRGTHFGVPRLIDILKAYNAQATFLFSLGPDNTGKAIKRVFRKGFLKKVSRTSVVEHYGIKTLLYGTLLPAPDISLKEKEILLKTKTEGFEVGVHTWDHIKWQDYVAHKNQNWTHIQMDKSFERFQLIFGEKPQTHGAAGWQMNQFAYQYELERGLKYASDGRGICPFIPCDKQQKIIGIPQLPTTLPTLDELIGLNDWTVQNVHKHILDMTAQTQTNQVYTLHAELEGMRLSSVFEKLLEGWKTQGHELVSLKTLFTSLNIANLPLCEISMGEIAGRSGFVALQGKTIKSQI